MEVFVLSLSLAPEKLITILTVAVGLGLVIFFHELGHFAVAKWCDVLVERFSIGFGPILLKKKWGETEYALSAIPFGGYVKMLGQDDIDPTEMTDAQKANQPRSYTAKNVWQRMAIISAGVIMNIITGTMFFAIVFGAGQESIPPKVGYVQPGLPAWINGVREGDTIYSINGQRTIEFEDIYKETFLSRGTLTFVGLHADGTRYEFTDQPFWNEYNRMMGLSFASSLKVRPTREKSTDSVTSPGSPADEAGFKPGDTIVSIDGQGVASSVELGQVLREKRAETIAVTVQRTDATSDETLSVKPMNFRTLGIRLDIGKVSAVRLNSPAAKAGIQASDRITKVDGRVVGPDLDPFRLPDYFSERHGQAVLVSLSRESKGGPPETLDVQVTPNDVPPWSEPPISEKDPLSIPSLGLAFQIIPKILSVAPDSPAAKAGIKEKQSIEEISFLPVEGDRNDILGPKEVKVEKVDETKIAHAFWLMQDLASARKVRLVVKTEGGETPTIDLEPTAEADWYLPTLRGLSAQAFMAETFILKGETVGKSIELGMRETRKRISEVFRTLGALIRGDLSIFKLSGPIGIAKIGYSVAQENLIQFIKFLGLISVNLAVINFLPIPLLDGGHMLFLLYEGISGRKPNERIVIGATYIGLMFIVGLMLFVLGIDLFANKK